MGTTTTRALESAARQEADEQRGRGAEEQRSGGAEGLGGASTDESSPLSRTAGRVASRSSAALAPRTSARIAPGTATTDLFIYPGFEFRVVNGLVTNFHLPCSSLLMLVSAFAGREIVLEAYRHAVEHEYRFYSYGDAMLIL